MEKYFEKTNISFFSDFEYDLPRDNLKKKISRLKWKQMCADIENQQILANAEKMLSEKIYEGISSSSDTDDEENKSSSEKGKQESEESLDENSNKRKSMRLRNQDPDFDPPSKLTRVALQTTMKEEQEKLLEKFRLRR